MAKLNPSTTSRLSAYTDAVFAVIITITVLELRPPASAHVTALLSMWPTFISYVVSYVFVAIVWMNHHYLISYVKVPTLRLIWINFAHLFFVSLVPFATAWMAQTELSRAPVVTYASLFVVTDGVYNLFEREVLRQSPEFTPAEYRATRRRSLGALVLFAVAAAVAVIEPWLGFLVICLSLTLHLRPDASRWARRRSRARRDDSSGTGTTS